MLQHPLHLGRFALGRLLLASILALLALGCGAPTNARTVSDVTLLESNPSALDTDDALGGLATGAPRKILWIERERDVYDANLVARDLERVERYYRAHGYYDVKVVAARVETVGERQVEIEIHVTPGPRVTVRKADFDPPRSTWLEASGAISELRLLGPGEPFEERRLDKQTTDVKDALTKAGYAHAQVKVRAKVDLSARAADVVTEVKAGRLTRIGEIKVIGLKRIPESKVRAALGLRRGKRYSSDDLRDAADALNELRIFGRVDVSPDLSHPEQEEVPINVTVQEDKLRALTLGGGTQLDSLKWDIHLRSDWEHKNWLGGARRFSVAAQGGVYFFPTRLETFDTLFRLTNAFPVGQLTTQLEQPSIFGGRTKASVQAQLSFRPVLYALDPKADPRQEVVLGYAKPSGRVGLERSFFRQRFHLTPSYNLEARIPFSYQNAVPAGLETVLVSYPKFVARFQSKPGDIFEDRNKRDLVVYFSSSLELAGLSINGRRYFGGSLSDLKIEPEARVVLPILGKRWQDEQKVGNLTLALRAKVGFILAPDYGSTLRAGQATTQSEITGDAALRDQQKLLSRAFYSGGSTSNRGYSFSSISPHGPVGFLIPTRVNCVTTRDHPSCTRPLGGFTLWEASAELRFAGFYPLTIVAFADASDVTRDIGVLGFKYPHLSVGPGLRYESPVGPLRLDFGIRVPGAQAIGQIPQGQRQPGGLPADLSHGKEQPNLGPIPGAIWLAFGDAF
jgi:outer membrane protein insertion porin family/translocation and assembly module TamA